MVMDVVYLGNDRKDEYCVVGVGFMWPGIVDVSWCTVMVGGEDSLTFSYSSE